MTVIESDARPSDPPHRRLWGLRIDPLTMDQALSRIDRWITATRRDCPMVVTPNVDHVVLLHRRPEIRQAYDSAELTVADGWPLVTMSRLLGKPLPQRVAGSDLLPGLMRRFDDAGRELKLFLLGGAEGVAVRAAQNIHRDHRHVNVVGQYSPPFGFEHDPDESEKIVAKVSHSGADVLVVGLGMPKQELWLYHHRSRLPVAVALAVGGTIDFVAGEQKRAPQFWQRARLEWLHRWASHPRRLTGRYLSDLFWFPILCGKEALAKTNTTDPGREA